MNEFPRIVLPSVQRIPVVVSVPHAGLLIPDDELSSYALSTQQLALDGDLYVDELYAAAPMLGATLISTPFSRFVVDLNRLPDDISPLAVTGARVRTDDGYYGKRGVIWAVNTRGEKIYRSPLSYAKYRERIENYYEPYHNLLSQKLSELREEFRVVILLDAHSMPSRASNEHPDTGSTRPDIVPGDLLGRSCDAGFSTRVCDFWRKHHYSVRLNHPYRGGGIVRQHGRPRQHIHAIQVELNRSLYMDEHTLERTTNFDSLATSCAGFVEYLGTQWQGLLGHH